MTYKWPFLKCKLCYNEMNFLIKKLNWIIMTMECGWIFLKSKFSYSEINFLKKFIMITLGNLLVDDKEVNNYYIVNCKTGNLL